MLRDDTDRVVELDAKAQVSETRQGIAVALRRAARCLISLLVLATAGEALAGGNVYIWDGGAGTGLWSGTANWDVTPVFDNQANLQFAGTVQTSVTNNVTGTIRNMQFNAGAGAFTVSGSAVLVGNAAGFVNSSSNLQTIDLAGIRLSANTNFNAGSAGMNISSPISGAFNFLIPATSTGTLSLSGSNSFTGAVTMSAGAGALRISNANALGTTGNGTTITTGGALELTNNITVGAEALSLVGTGLSSGGALRNISGTNTYSGTITLQGATRINSDAGELILNVSSGNAIQGTADNLTFGGAGNITVNDVINNTTATLTKDGVGLLTLAASNTYSGATTISAGSIRATTSTNALGQGTLSLGGGTLELANDTGLNYGRNTTLTASGTIFSERLTADAGTLLTTSTVTGNFGLAIGGAGNTTIAGFNPATVAQTLTKSGAGTLTLSATSAYTGLTTISGGTLAYGVANALSTGGVTIQNGASLNLSTFGDSVGQVTLTSGDIVGSGTLTSTANFNTNSGTISAVLAGTNFGIVQGTGTTVVTSSNAFTGGSSVASGGVLNVRNAGALGTTGTATVSSGGALELQNSGTLARRLSLSGTGISGNGALRNVSGTNGISAAITLGAATRINSDADLLTLSGTTISGAFGLTFGGAGNITVSNTIATGANTLTKDGAGTLKLSGSNTYTGATTVSAGVLNVHNSSGLGTTAGGVTVSNGAALELQGGIAVGAEALSIAGTGISSGGALRNVSGTNSYAGAITQTAATLVNVDAGQLTLSGNIGGGFGLTFGGAGNTIVSGTIATGANGLTKTGAGTLTLSSSNTYTGATAIEQGSVTADRIVVAAGASSLGNASSAVTLGGASTSGTLSYTGVSATYTRGFTLGAGGGRLDVTTAGQTVTIATGGVDGTGLFTVGGAGNVNATAVISTNGGVTKTGTGTLTLSNANTFGGVLTGSAGVIRATTNAAALGAGSLALAGSTLELANDTGLNFGRNTTMTTSGTIFSERLTAGAGVTHTLGTLTIGSQTLTVATDATLTSGTAGLAFTGATLTGDATFAVDTGAALTFTGAMSGSFGITKSGGGVLTLADASGHGNTTVSGGRLNVNFLSALGTTTGTLSMAAGTTLGNTSGDAVTVGNAKAIALGSSLAFAGPSALNLGSGVATLSATNTTIDVAVSTLTFGGNVVGNGLGITKTGSGTLVFTHLGVGAYTGNTTISQGELFLDGLSVLGGGTGTIVTIQNGAFLRIGSSASVGNVTVNTWTGGVISGTTVDLNVNFTSSGTLSPTDSFINGTQNITSGITVSATANYFGAIPASPVADRIVIQNSGTLQSLSSFDIEPTQGVLVSTGTATFNVSGAGGQRLFLESTVSGSGALRKNGANNLRLLGNNTYTGGTIIEQGIIGIVADASLGAVSGGVQIVGGELVGAQTAAGAATDVTIAAARSITIGNGVTSAISAQTGNRLAYGGALAEVDGGGAAGNLRVGLAGARAGLVVLGGTNTYRGSTTLAAGTLEVSVLANGGAASSIGQSSNAAANLVLEGGSKLKYTGGNASTDRLFTLGAGGATIDSGSGTLAFTNAGSAALAGTGARTFTLDGNGTGHLAAVLADLDPANKTSLIKTGLGTWELTSAQQFTGDTTISGGTLLVNGSLASDVATLANTTLGGSGSIAGTLSGAGLVSPGNSPGIIEASAFDPTGGLDAAFEFTGPAPNYANVSSSINDVLRLTGASPFNGSALGAGNVIDIYLNAGTVNYLDEFEGGFYAENFTPEQLLAAVSDATYVGWMPATGAGTRTFNGINYDPIFLTPGLTKVKVETKAGPDGGAVTVFVAVPEPGSIVLAGLGLIALAGHARLRRMRRAGRRHPTTASAPPSV
jgi:fibronectin-binding autotransporter adhesin